MPFFAKAGDQWVVLDDKKTVLYSDPDKAKALAFFKTIGTKPENTCPHPKIKREVRGRPPKVTMDWYERWGADPAGWGTSGGKAYWTIHDKGDLQFVSVCVTCGKETDTKKDVVDSRLEANL